MHDWQVVFDDEHSMQAVSKLTNQWIELFRAGDHGKPKGVEFTPADLDQIVANYNADAGHEAPALIGHPKEEDREAPAYGWFDSLKRSGSVLMGKMRQVDPQFEELVENGRFKKRSVGLVKTDKGWSLHHVAWLGATAPHVKGLADAKFEKTGTPVVEVEFQENEMANESQDTVLAALKAWFEERFGTKTPVAGAVAFTAEDVKRIAGEAVTAAVKPLEDKITAQATTFSERDKQLATVETAARANAAIAKVKASGRWIPAFEKMGLGLVFAALATNVETIEFGEGDAKKKLTPLDTLVAFMEQLGKIVPAGDLVGGQIVKPAAGAIHFSAKHGADANSAILANLAKERATKDKITFGEALVLIAAEQPELAIPGGATAGAV